jgi:hypothetical protein
LARLLQILEYFLGGFLQFISHHSSISEFLLYAGTDEGQIRLQVVGHCFSPNWDLELVRVEQLTAVGLEKVKTELASVGLEVLGWEVAANIDEGLLDLTFAFEEGEIGQLIVFLGSEEALLLLEVEVGEEAAHEVKDGNGSHLPHQPFLTLHDQTGNLVDVAQQLLLRLLPPCRQLQSLQVEDGALHLCVDGLIDEVAHYLV